jgi:hypothetical protein
MRLAELVVEVEAQQQAATSNGGTSGAPSIGGLGGACGGGGSAAATFDGASAGPWAPQQFLEASCDMGGRLWSDAMQLFPRDMGSLLEEYR